MMEEKAKIRNANGVLWPTLREVKGSLSFLDRTENLLLTDAAVAALVRLKPRDRAEWFRCFFKEVARRTGDETVRTAERVLCEVSGKVVL